ncbi:aminotransferase, class I/II [Fusobacterium sp. oral taxon 370 str. F0437]|uniref:pyridoxal phosphate-dependent aminotransferase n=1 Tax=Fusobacterium sp. oral taxon 370 TaxID=712288 RepID=UPI000234A19C|nr:pyridoxal phosphate-dependent aminotransferase [Fusobacterium sp. oral taxon 370]EHI79682.1 aminotransferase, class I/II [Fusobacterium sp. oral taxon 370 str. F0437]
MRISEKALNMKYSAVRKLVPLATEAESKGVKVYRLNIGQPNIETSELFFEGLRNIPDHVIRYADSRGIKELLDQVIEVYLRDGHLLKKEDIIVTEGGSEALTMAMLTICNPDDEVLVPEPFYSNYKSFIDIAGAKIVPIATDITNDFALPKKEDIQKLISPKTKAILYSNPCNPTGKVYTKEEVELMADLAVENDLFIVADEPYREFIYDDNDKHYSLLDIEKAKENTVIIDSVSKHYSACGARVGFLISKNEEFMTYIMKFCQARLAAPTVEQYAVANLMKAPKEYFKGIKEIYNRRRDIIVNSLNKIEGVTCSTPKGAIYAFAKLPVDSSEEFCKWLLTDFRYDNSTVMLAPGEGFYETAGLGKQEVRFSFCVGEEDIEKAMKVLEEALKVYKK